MNRRAAGKGRFWKAKPSLRLREAIRQAAYSRGCVGAATRDYIRYEVDADRRRQIQLGAQRHAGLAVHCWTAAEGDPLEALALAIERVAEAKTTRSTSSALWRESEDRARR